MFYFWDLGDFWDQAQQAIRRAQALARSMVCSLVFISAHDALAGQWFAILFQIFIGTP